MEFRESSIPRPEPLRIVKHPASFKNSYSSRKISIPGSSSSGEDLDAQLESTIGDSSLDLSPPQISNGRLTIRKRREIKDSSVFSGHLEYSQGHEMGNSQHDDCSRQTGSSIRVVDSRILKMLKSNVDIESESLLGIKENDQKLSLGEDSSNRYNSCLSQEQPVRDITTVGSLDIPLAASQNQRGPRNSSEHSSGSDLGMQRIPTSISRSSVEDAVLPLIERPDELQRRISTGRKLFKRAKNGLGSLRLKTRKPSKEPVSESDYKQSATKGPRPRISTDCSWSVVSRKDASETRSMPESTNSFQPTPTFQAPTTLYVVSPKFEIYPEVDSITSGSDYLIRVAVKITGVLKPVLSVLQQENESDLLLLTSTSGHEMKKYGTMHDFDVACFDMLGSPVEYMITPDRQPSIGVGDSYLLILGVRVVAFARFRYVSNGHVRTTSDEMIEDLTSHLGLVEFPYLRINMSCQHTAFQCPDQTSLPVGCNYQATRLETEVRAAIRVLPPPDSSLSSWGLNQSNACPDNSTASFVFDNVLRSSLSSQEMHDYMTEMSSWEIPEPVQMTYDTEYDVGTIRRKSVDRSSDTVIQPNMTSSTSMASFRTARSEFYVSPLRLLRSNAPSPIISDDDGRSDSLNSTPKVSDSHTRPDDPETPDYNPSEDPASKIWKEMRKNSTGSARRKSLVPGANSNLYSSTSSLRTSNSSDSNTSAPSEMSMGMILPPRDGPNILSLDSMDNTPRSNRTNTGDLDVNEDEDVFWQEKEMIRQEALRNKRSISADTVHSLAGGSSGQRGIGIRAGFWGLFG